VRARPEIQVARLGRQLGGERERLATAETGEIVSGESSAGMPAPGAVADHVEVGDRAEGRRLESDVEVYRVGPRGHGDHRTVRLSAQARDEA
jgi:hypothetical protein